MIGIVIVSHSARLAEGVCELAAQVAQGRVRLAAAGGTDDEANPIGTDAFRVREAIESVYSEDGVLVFMDLGSAVLSAETALDLLDESQRRHVRLCKAPVVEGAVAAVSQAAAGAPWEEILAESGPGRPAGVEHIARPPNALGIHARPAARLVRLARGFGKPVTIENLSRATGPVEARGIQGLLELDARQGDELRIRSEDQAAAAAVAAFIEGGCGDEVGGLAASAGIAIGPLARLLHVAVAVERRTVEDPEKEWQRLQAAIDDAHQESRELSASAGKQGGIFDAQTLFLEDDALLEELARLVLEERLNAEFAWQQATAERAARLGRLDVSDVGGRVLRRLTGAPAGPALAGPCIVAAHDLTPSQVQALDAALVMGICLESGGAGAHSVILARARGIPVVAGVELAGVEEGVTVALDGERGRVWVEPGAARRRELEERREAWLAARRAASESRHRPGATRDGRRIRVVANISGVADAAQAVESGAEGVGVLRSEFLFLNRATAPDEEEQYQAYRAIAEALGGRPLVIRTLDVGGDKQVPYVDCGKEANPFLGFRGIRLTLGRRELLRTQARAILRAGGEILLPMISTPDELREARTVIGDGARVGVMIEVPAAVEMAEELAREADFFSIGTNDLTQYVMAADRTNPSVAALADGFQPAVLRAIRESIEAGRRAGIPVAVCGELAADPLAAPLLLGLGLEEFSVSAPLVAGVKSAIARWSIPEAEAVARQALALDSAAAVRQWLSKQL